MNSNGMPFYEMIQHYPDILNIFRQVMEQVHAGATAGMTARSTIRPYIQKHIRPEHREAVAAKLTKWAEVVEEGEGRESSGTEGAQMPDLFLRTG